jgi:hypothetical protein
LASLVGEENETASLREQRRQFATCDFFNSPPLLISTTLVVGRQGKVNAMKGNGQTATRHDCSMGY